MNPFLFESHFLVFLFSPLKYPPRIVECGSRLTISPVQAVLSPIAAVAILPFGWFCLAISIACSRLTVCGACAVAVALSRSAGHRMNRCNRLLRSFQPALAALTIL